MRGTSSIRKTLAALENAVGIQCKSARVLAFCKRHKVGLRCVDCL